MEIQFKQYNRGILFYRIDVKFGYNYGDFEKNLISVRCDQFGVKVPRIIARTCGHVNKRVRILKRFKRT